MRALRRVAFRAMGTRVEVVLDGGAGPDAEAAVQALFAAREAVLSRFLHGSELSRANRAAGRPAPAGEVLLDAVEAAMRAAAATGGAFDPGLGARMEAIGYDRTFERVADGPAGAPLAPPPGPAGGWRRIRVDRDRGTVTVPAGLALDLGGIAKGMAVDAAIALLRDGGAEAALVSAGGDLAVLGTPPGRDGWTVAVRTPRGAVPVTLEAGALATSGVERRAWRQGAVPRHHLVDPATGEPARAGLWSATAVAGSCERAEAAATAAFVLGAGGGARLLTRLGMAGLLVAPAGARLPVGAWPRAGEAAA